MSEVGQDPAEHEADAESESNWLIVGVGASAGGLEALEALFAAVPEELEAAFVVVQHLSPDHESLMPRLLARRTALPVEAVEDGVAIEPRRVYLIPPRKEMILANGRLLLADREPTSGLLRPIDQFFRSLAAEAGSRAVAVVLSGTGDDGSRGALDVAEREGYVIAQAPESATFDGMPRALIDTGAADAILRPEEIPAEIARRAEQERARPPILAVREQAAELDAVFELLRADFDVHFEEYRSSTIERRLQRRVVLREAGSIAGYLAQLAADRTERSALYHDLLIGVTRFFRDPEAFERLQHEILPPLIESARERNGLRLWIAGCATGEEAYSIAMLLHELVPDELRGLPLKLFATDVHQRSIKFASDGVYPADSVANLSAERRERFFRKHESGGWVVAPLLRRTVAFARHDLLRDPPFRHVDLITCRNLLIYLQPRAQRRVLSLFHFALRTGGALMLGPSETLGDLTTEFEELDPVWRIYRKRRDVRLAPETAGPGLTDTHSRSVMAAAASTQAAKESSLIDTYDALLARYLPPSFLVDEDFQLLHTFAGAERWIQVRGGRVSTRLPDLLPEDVGSSVALSLQHAARTHREVRVSGARSVQASAGAPSDGLGAAWRIVVQPFDEPKSGARRFLVQLDPQPERDAEPDASAEAVEPSASFDYVASLRRELLEARQSLRSTVEDLETSNEELQSTNEELATSNEELQSSNEELQSVNEELHTVNAEHQRKIVELTQLSDDMNNLLESAKVGVMILDEQLTIRRFTPEIARMFQLAPQDLGRRIEVFASGLDYPGLISDLRKVIATGESIELEARDSDGAPYLVRILPYRSSNRARGAVLTLVDMQHIRDVEDDLAMFKFLSLHAVDAQVLLDDQDRIEYANEAATRLLGRSTQWMDGRAWRELVDFDLGAVIEEACETQARLEEFELEDAYGTARTVEVSAKSMTFRGRRYCFVSLRDVSSRKQFERRLKVEHAVAAALAEAETVAEGLQRVLEEFVGGFDLFVAELWSMESGDARLAAQVYGARSASAETWRRASREAAAKPGAGLIGRLWSDFVPNWYSDLNAHPDLLRYDVAVSLGLRTAFGISVRSDDSSGYVLACFSRDPIGVEAELIDVLVSVRNVLRQFLRRQRVEEVLLLRNSAIEEAREGMIIVDARAPDMPVVYVNPAFEQLTGYAMSEIAGRNCRFLQGAGTDEAARVALREAIAERREQRVTILNYTKDGREFWNQLHISPVRDSSGEVTHFVGVQHDVTGMLAIQEELREAREAARAANRAKTEFLANISHEIRTPLSSVIGFCDILLERTRDRESIDDLRAIRRNGAFLAALIEDILDLSRIEAGRLRIESEALSITELVLDLAALMQVRAQERRLELSFEFETETPSTIRSDRVRVRQILVNLIGNALKFTETGGVRVALAFRPDGDAPQIDFRVLDTGLGIDPEDTERIFEAFTQSRRSNVAHAAGAGLGLTICRRLARELGGDVLVQSELGVGSQFTLRIPTGSLEGVEIVRPGLRAIPISVGGADDIRGRLAGVRALVVDDIADVRRVARHFLESAGATVEVAETGARARDAVMNSLARNAPFDVVLMDIQLPDTSGDEVVAELREQGFTNPVLAVTASAMPDECERWIEAGCDDVIAKPVKGPELVRAIAGHLERRRRRPTGETTAIVRPVEVLLAEDNADAAESTSKLLESRGAVVRVAESGLRALELFRQHRPELVVTDMRLADLDGCALVASMAAAKSDPRPLFVALSGLDDEQSIADARAAGCDEYLVKPVEPTRLFELLDRAIARRAPK